VWALPTTSAGWLSLSEARGDERSDAGGGGAAVERKERTLDGASVGVTRVSLWGDSRRFTADAAGLLFRWAGMDGEAAATALDVRRNGVALIVVVVVPAALLPLPLPLPRLPRST
jgi:hypothetical protein